MKAPWLASVQELPGRLDLASEGSFRRSPMDGCEIHFAPKKPWLTPVFVGIYRGIESFQGVLGETKWILSISMSGGHGSKEASASDMTQALKGFRGSVCFPVNELYPALAVSMPL